MKVQQSAGNCQVEVYTDGSPLWSQLTITEPGDHKIVAHLSVADLHDLRYCIDRVLALLPPRAA